MGNALLKGNYFVRNFQMGNVFENSIFMIFMGIILRCMFFLQLVVGSRYCFDGLTMFDKLGTAILKWESHSDATRTHNHTEPIGGFKMFQIYCLFMFLVSCCCAFRAFWRCVP